MRKDSIGLILVAIAVTFLIVSLLYLSQYGNAVFRIPFGSFS